MAGSKASINLRGLRGELGKQVRPILLPRIKRKVDRAVEQAKSQLMDDFLSHLITQEIQEGSNGRNLSGTLDGYGNLFSYIGFEEGSDPIAPIRRYLEKALKVKMIRQQARNASKQALTFIVTLELPDKEDIEQLSPVPWAPGRSWVDAMERGLSGLGQYLARESDVSRSGTAVQVKVDFRRGAFKNQSYLSPILKAIRSNIHAAMKV